MIYESQVSTVILLHMNSATFSWYVPVADPDLEIWGAGESFLCLASLAEASWCIRPGGLGFGSDSYPVAIHLFRSESGLERAEHASKNIATEYESGFGLKIIHSKVR